MPRFIEKNKIEELVEKLQSETTSEVLSNTKELCNASMKNYTCTRPKGHSGYHIASAPGYIVVMWYHVVSD